MESKEIKECNWGKELIAQVARRVSEVAQFDPIQEINGSSSTCVGGFATLFC